MTISTTSETPASSSAIASGRSGGVLVNSTESATPSAAACSRSSGSYGPVPTTRSRASGRSRRTSGKAAITRWWPL